MTTPKRTELDAAYRATRYLVDGPNGRFAVRVGRASPEADALAEAHGATAWAYITAYNPGSVRASEEENRARQRELDEAVRVMALAVFRGEGKGDDDAWPAEPSLLVLGIAEAEALTLARRFGQAAVVFGERGGPARLLWA
jgi:hypothetical protein